MAAVTRAIRPTSAEDLAEAVLDAQQSGTRLAIAGGSSKAAIGAPSPNAVMLDMRGFAGVVDYDPAELVLTVGAGTPLCEVEAMVAGQGQMLAFAPFDHGPVFGAQAGAATIGGVVAAGVAGSQRLTQGGARDHLLGFRGVSGRGEPLVGGSKVVKNVTGYDLPKLMAGSWGRLAAMTELTLKVVPSPRETATRILRGLDAASAVRAMALALASQAEVAAAAHFPGELLGGASLTALRIQGFAASVASRCAMLDQVLEPLGRAEPADAEEAERIRSALRTLSPLDGKAPLWRINVPPASGPKLVETLAPRGARWLMDWAGGLVWAALDAPAETVRDAAAIAGGHAILVRADAAMRAHIPAFHPPSPGIAAIEARMRRAFDPAGVFETGRFGDLPA